MGQRIEEAIELMEMELRHAIAYVNDAVVPQVRSESITAMRKVAESLQKLADRMDQTKGLAADRFPRRITSITSVRGRYFPVNSTKGHPCLPR